MSIQSIPGWQNKTAAELLASMQETVSQATNRTILVADILDTLGMENTRIVLATLDAASVDPIVAYATRALGTVGISLSGELRQGMIDQLAAAGQWTNEVRDALKGLGVVSRPRWEVLGYDAEPTVESIEAEQAAAIHASRMINAVALFNERMTVGGDASAVMAQAWEDAV